MANLTFNAIDVETANRTRASICQIGIAQVQVGKISRAASFLVNPEEPFESFQTGLHGINEEAVSEAETMLSIHPKLYRLIERTPLASHSPFDKQALEKAASKYGLTMPQIKWLDTGRVARSAWPDRYDGSSWGLKKIAADLGIEFLHHDAAEDARAAAEILLHACRHTGLDVDDWLEQAGYERTPEAKTNTQQVDQTNHERKISEGIPHQSALPPWTCAIRLKHLRFYGCDRVYTSDTRLYDVVQRHPTGVRVIENVTESFRRNVLRVSGEAGNQIGEQSIVVGH